ncbi:MAG: transferase hexapeptide repeat containing protein [Geminicoccaceae bacterium]|nr:transferase hexapeptide repeat containing protein [Geminicoccaceae bacterium]
MSIFIHESSYVDDGASVGDGTKIWHFCHVMTGAVIGERCNLGQNVVVMPGTRIGNNVKVQNNVSIYEGVELEDDVFCGPSMVFTNVVNPRSHVSRKREYRRTLVRRGATIGANATVVCGVTLGEYAFVGAGAVVTKDVKPFALVTGVPARQVGWMCQCGERISGHFEWEPGTGNREPSAKLTTIVCGVCQTKYAFENGELRFAEAP